MGQWKSLNHHIVDTQATQKVAFLFRESSGIAQIIPFGWLAV